MHSKHFLPKKIFIAVALITSGAILGDVVTSFAAPSSSLISACVDRSTGVMRYLQKGRCKKTELAVRWNIQGPVGSQGLEGLQGPRGATGAIGAAGPQGQQGPPGNEGTASSSTVRSGSGVPSNSLGSNGDFYINTLTNMIHGPKAGDVWPNGVSLVGPTGATGATGQTGLQGVLGQGVFSYVAPVTTTKRNENTDSILLANYTPIANVGSDIEVSLACGYVTVSTPSIVAWSIAVKAPTGSSIFGHTTMRNDSAPESVVGSALGTRQRLAQDQAYLKLTNAEFMTVNVFGPSINPVVFKLAISITADSCTASGIKQTT
jgi:hypothetical protein